MNSYEKLKDEQERLERLGEIEKMRSKLGGEKRSRRSDLVEEVAEIMCDRYCKYPASWDADLMGYEISESNICASCPMRLL